MKVAIVHDYLNQAGGAERVVAVLHRMFPDAPIFVTLFDPAAVGAPLADADVRVSWMQRLPGWRRHFKKYLPLYPVAVRSFDLRGYDLVLSSSSAWAKGVSIPKGAVHVCYCYTPMRWAWSLDGYLARSELGPLARLASRALAGPLRWWDVHTARRVDRFVAISTEVARRIRTSYGRDCDIVFPPVDVNRFQPDDRAGDYYLVVSRLNAYKRIDLAVEACTMRGLPLVIVGDGPARPSLERIAGPTVRFAGRLSDREVADLFSHCRAFILPGAEDFGLTPLEANAAGRPVVAFGSGGALDTVRDGETGVLFQEPDAKSLVRALDEVSSRHWDARALRAHAESFAEPVFAACLRAVIDEAVRRRRGLTKPGESGLFHA
ncbi:MAG TPA: glycosyltransferase [Gemmatimonadaceae bacterium]